MGNASIYDSAADNTGEPFVIVGFGGTANTVYTSDANKKIALKITERVEGVRKLPMSYLPEGAVTSVNGIKPDGNGNVSVAAGGTAGIDVTATAGQTIVVKEVDNAGKPIAWEARDYSAQSMIWMETHSTDPTCVNVSVDQVEAALEHGKLPILKRYNYTDDGSLQYISTTPLAGFATMNEYGHALLFYSILDAMMHILIPQEDGSYLMASEE